MAAHEKSISIGFFLPIACSLHSGTNNKIKWDMCLCILNFILKYPLVPGCGGIENWHWIHIC